MPREIELRQRRRPSSSSAQSSAPPAAATPSSAAASTATPPPPTGKACRKRLATCCNAVSLLWFEKGLILLDALQDYTVLWGMAYTWKWPAAWLSSTRWTLLTTVDIPTLSMWDTQGAPTVDGAATLDVYQWGALPDYYDVFVGCLVGAAMLVVVCAVAFSLCGRACGLRRSILARCIDPSAYALLFGRVFIGALARELLRLWACDDGTLTVDASIACWSGTHVALLLTAFPLGLLALVGALLVMRHRVYRNIVHATTAEHERDLVTVELEYLLGWSARWRTSNVWVVSSFRRPQAARYLFAMSRKCALAVIHVALRNTPRTQAVATLLLFLYDALHTTLIAPYRSIESNLISFVVVWTLVFNAVIGFLSSYSHNSPVLLDEPLTAWLVGVHGCAAVCIALVLCVGLLRCARWPADFPHGAEAIAVERWSLLVEEGLECRRQAQLSPAGVLQVDAIVPIERKLRAATDEATRRKSPLAPALHALVEDLESLRLEAHAVSPFPTANRQPPPSRRYLRPRRVSHIASSSSPSAPSPLPTLSLPHTHTHTVWAQSARGRAGAAAERRAPRAAADAVARPRADAAEPPPRTPQAARPPHSARRRAVRR